MLVCRFDAEAFGFRVRGEEEESGVEELRREVKSTADEERCIKVQARVSFETGRGKASLIVGEGLDLPLGPKRDCSQAKLAKSKWREVRLWGNATDLSRIPCTLR